MESSNNAAPVVQMEKVNEQNVNEVKVLRREVKENKNDGAKSKKGSKNDGGSFFSLLSWR